MDSRAAEDGAAIRRRRECTHCGRRFTTFERVEDVPFLVVKRSGQREPFDRRKIVAGALAACKNRPVTEEQLEALALQVEEELRAAGGSPTSQMVGVAVLEALRAVDDVAYLRFASVYKGFEELGDFQREVGRLTKTTRPKGAGGGDAIGGEGSGGPGGSSGPAARGGGGPDGPGDAAGPDDGSSGEPGGAEAGASGGTVGSARDD